MENKTEVAVQPLTPEEILRIVRDMASRAPVVEPVAVVSATQRRKLSSLSPEFVDFTLGAINASGEVQAALGRTDADVKAETSASTDWSVAIDTLLKFANELVESNANRRLRNGLTALQTYKICSSLATDKKHASLQPRVADMKRSFSRRRKPAATQQTPSQQ